MMHRICILKKSELSMRISYIYFTLLIHIYTFNSFTDSAYDLITDGSVQMCKFIRCNNFFSAFSDQYYLCANLNVRNLGYINH